MDLLKKLNQKKQHRFKEILDRFPRQNIASELGITYGHYSSIITGVREPSKALELKFETLASQILQSIQKNETTIQKDKTDEVKII